MSYRIELAPGAVRGFDALPGRVQDRVRRLLDALTLDPRPASAEPLTGPLAGLRKLRAGSYRICYQVTDHPPSVRVVGIGHRRDIYRRLARTRPV